MLLVERAEDANLVEPKRPGMGKRRHEETKVDSGRDVTSFIAICLSFFCLFLSIVSQTDLESF